MDKTYVETQGKPTFNWLKALEKACVQEPTYEECSNMLLLSQQWGTCACGNQCAIIPRDELGMPEDFELRVNGSCFFYQVERGGWHNALTIFHKIEARSNKLILDELAKLNASLHAANNDLCV